MKRFAILLMMPAFALLTMPSCSWLMNPQEEERIPEPPPGPQKSQKSHNQYQRFEANSALGPFATQRR